MQRARFAKGALAPKGLLYWLDEVPLEQDWPALVRKSILGTTRILDGLPLPWIGVRGIRHLAGKIGKLDAQGHKYNRLYLTHIVRMQEEIGTGGAGFRFMYASFLQEAGRLIGDERLCELSTRLTATGDQWRQFASLCVQHGRSKQNPPPLSQLSDSLLQIADSEQQLIAGLKGWLKG